MVIVTLALLGWGIVFGVATGNVALTAWLLLFGIMVIRENAD